MSNLDLLDKAFRDHFPATAENELASIDYVSVSQRDGGSYGVVIRLIGWELNADAGVKSIRDVKEQEIYLGLPGLDLATIGRMRELLAAMVRVLEKALTHAEVESLMPHDLVDFGPLKLARSKTVDDFVKAYSVPSRLGRYLPNPA